MSNQSLNRVLRFQYPTVYFRALSQWSTEGYRQQTLPPSRYQGPAVPMTRSIEGYMSTSDYYRNQGRNQRRVHLSESVPDNEGAMSSVEEVASTVVECCKPEWIKKGWKCYTCGKGLVARTVDPYDRVDEESDDSGEGAYIISCTPSGLSGRAATQSRSSSSSSGE